MVEGGKREKAGRVYLDQSIPKTRKWDIEKSRYDADHQLKKHEPQPLHVDLPRQFPGMCKTRRREQPEFGRVSMFTV